MATDGNPSSSRSDVTVLVFKDNLSARTFQIPLQWFSRFGFFLGLLAGAALLTSFLAVKFYRAAIKTDPSHVMDLEQELADLKTSYKALEIKNQDLKTAAQTAAVAQVAAANGNATASMPSQLPVPAVTVTVTAPPAAAPPVAAAAPAPEATVKTLTPGFLFSALPSEVQAPPADAATLPIKVENLKASWTGKSLQVKFDIQYVSEDKGNQQGRIIILARGPETLLAYPDGVLNRTGAGSLIAPDQGEFFSVSHFRAVKAEFGPVRSPSMIQDVEILILGSSAANTTTNGRLLVHELIAPEAPPVEKPVKSAKPKPKPAAPPASATGSTPPASASDGSQVISPGYDQ